MTAKKPLLVSLIVFWAICVYLLVSSFEITSGHFGYPLDDTYIHMAISKHFVNNGVWGVSLDGFTSSTSSPLWTFLLSLGYVVFGVNEWLPFLMAFVVGNFTVVLCFLILSRKLSSYSLNIALIIIVILVPIPILTLIGMEHMFHGFLSLLLSYCTAIYLSKHDRVNKYSYLMFFLSGLIAITRYEGLFLIFSIFLLLIFHKKCWQAFMVLISGALPISIYGMYSVSKGWKFLPNSVLLKGYSPTLTLNGIIRFFHHIFENLGSSPQLLIIIITFLLLFIWPYTRIRIKKRERSLAVIFLITSVLHSQFSSFGWFYRYEAYLILMGSVFIIDLLGSMKLIERSGRGNNYFASFLLIGLGMLIIIPLQVRAKNAFSEYPFAVKNIYEQQYQIGLFLNEYYSNRSIAANDIGTINYLADIRTLDLWGIASLEVLEARQNKVYTSNFVNTLVNDNEVVLVILDSATFRALVPPNWIEVGKWQITDNVINSNSTVTFYVPNCSQLQNAISSLEDFSDLLPKSVIQTGLYYDQ